MDNRDKNLSHLLLGFLYKLWLKIRRDGHE